MFVTFVSLLTYILSCLFFYRLHAHVSLCHFFSSSWCWGLAATSACGLFLDFSVYLFPKVLHVHVHLLNNCLITLKQGETCRPIPNEYLIPNNPRFMINTENALFHLHEVFVKYCTKRTRAFCIGQWKFQVAFS